MGTLWGWLVKWEPAQTTGDPSQDRLCLALTAGARVFSPPVPCRKLITSPLCPLNQFVVPGHLKGCLSAGLLL